MLEKINKEIASAMKSGDKIRLMTMRMMKAKILHVNARGDLPEKEIIKILQNHAKSLQETIDICKQHGKEQEKEQAEKELAIVSEYLPKMLGEAETKAIVQEVISSLGIASQKEIGKIMKEILGKHSDIDGSMVRKIVMELLP